MQPEMRWKVLAAGFRVPMVSQTTIDYRKGGLAGASYIIV